METCGKFQFGSTVLQVHFIRSYYALSVVGCQNGVIHNENSPKQHDEAKAQQIIADPANDARGSEGMEPASNKRRRMRILSHVGRRRIDHEVDEGETVVKALLQLCRGWPCFLK